MGLTHKQAREGHLSMISRVDKTPQTLIVLIAGYLPESWITSPQGHRNVGLYQVGLVRSVDDVRVASTLGRSTKQVMIFKRLRKSEKNLTEKYFGSLSLHCLFLMSMQGSNQWSCPCLKGQ